MRVFLLGGVVGDSPAADGESIAASGRILGRCLAVSGHDLVIGSPFEDSVDFHAVHGAGLVGASVTMHYPNSRAVVDAVDLLLAAQPRLQAHRRVHAKPDDETRHALRNAWLLSQLEGMNDSDVIVAIGGRPGGSASLLLHLADARQKPILPFAAFGGAAESAFGRRFYELRDVVGDDGMIALNSRNGLDAIGDLIRSRTTCSIEPTGRDRVFFISYPRRRPSDADFVETILRRRGFVVLRDEHSFGESDEVPQAIRENIYRATVFVATWCAEYACSPHCHDELELAMSRHREGKLDVWLFRVDDTRIVPPSARNLVHYSANTRAELEGHVCRLLERG